jgi:hypothetical protein
LDVEEPCLFLLPEMSGKRRREAEVPEAESVLQPGELEEQEGKRQRLAEGIAQVT